MAPLLPPGMSLVGQVGTRILRHMDGCKGGGNLLRKYPRSAGRMDWPAPSWGQYCLEGEKGAATALLAPGFTDKPQIQKQSGYGLDMYPNQKLPAWRTGHSQGLATWKWLAGSPMPATPQPSDTPRRHPRSSATACPGGPKRQSACWEPPGLVERQKDCRHGRWKSRLEPRRC